MQMADQREQQKNINTITKKMNESIPLPPYLAPLPQSDPEWAALNASAYEYAYGPNPGDGYLESFQIVVFTEPHHAYRVWGGPSSECGYWWVLAPPSGRSHSYYIVFIVSCCSNFSLTKNNGLLSPKIALKFAQGSQLQTFKKSLLYALNGIIWQTSLLWIFLQM